MNIENLFSVDFWKNISIWWACGILAIATIISVVIYCLFIDSVANFKKQLQTRKWENEERKKQQQLEMKKKAIELEKLDQEFASEQNYIFFRERNLQPKNTTFLPKESMVTYLDSAENLYEMTIGDFKNMIIILETNGLPIPRSCLFSFEDKSNSKQYVLGTTLWELEDAWKLSSNLIDSRGNSIHFNLSRFEDDHIFIMLILRMISEYDSVKEYALTYRANLVADLLEKTKKTVRKSSVLGSIREISLDRSLEPFKTTHEPDLVPKSSQEEVT